MSFISTLLDRPIAFQRPYVTISKSVTGGLMLSQALYWTKITKDVNGWFYKSQKEWEDETGMTRYEQESARKKLKGIGVLEEVKKGNPCRLYFRVNHEVLISLLSALAEKDSCKQESDIPACGNPAYKDAENQHAGIPHTSMVESSTLGCGNPPNKDAENQHASLQETSTLGCGNPTGITENTTKTTSEITAKTTDIEAHASKLFFESTDSKLYRDPSVKKFRMYSGWSPEDQTISTIASSHGILLDDAQVEIIRLEFTIYWADNGCLKHNAEWNERFVQRVLNRSSHGRLPSSSYESQPLVAAN